MITGSPMNSAAIMRLPSAGANARAPITTRSARCWSASSLARVPRAALPHVPLPVDQGHLRFVAVARDAHQNGIAQPAEQTAAYLRRRVNR